MERAGAVQWLLLLSVTALAGCVSTSQNSQPSANDSQAARINVQLGAAYMRQGNKDRAMHKLQLALKQDPKLPVAHTVVALLYEQRGDTDKADQEYHKALALKPNDPDTQNIYGTFLCRQNHLREADKYFVAAAKNPDYPTPEAAYTNAGICALKIPDRHRAAAEFRKALAINANYPDALWQMAKLDFKRRKYLNSRAFVQRLSTQIQHDPKVLWLGYRIETALNDQQAADNYATELLNEFPQSEQAQKLQRSENQ